SRVAGDVLARVEKLKTRRGGALQPHGRWALARSLPQAALIDEYRLLVSPAAVGRGKRLFAGDAPATGFRLTDSAVTSTGAVYSVLTPAPFEAGTVEVTGGKEAV